MSNYQIATGTIAEPPKFTTAKNGTAIASFKLEVPADPGRDGSVPTVERVTAFGDLAAIVETIRRGQRILVAGRRRSRAYDHQGQQRTAHEVLADAVVPLEAQQVAPVASVPSRPAYGAQAGAQGAREVW